MVPLSALLLLASSQVAPTVPSRFLVHNGAAYVASPTYAVKSVTTNERFSWSHDGSRLAIVSDSSTDPPSTQARKLIKGELPDGPMRLGVWSRDTGRVRDVLTTAGSNVSIGSVGFVGSDLVVESTGGGAADCRVWIVRDGSTAQPLALPGFAGHLVRFIESRRGDAVLIGGEDGLWLVSRRGVQTIPSPKDAMLYARGMTADGRAIITVVPKTGSSGYILVNLSTGAPTHTAEPPSPVEPANVCPFVLNAYGLNGTKGRLATGGDDSGKVDAKMAEISDEDGGYRLDLVERAGGPRRRMPFLNETARTLEVSADGLGFAFVSNGILMVRYLVRCDPTATKRFVDGG